jgi:glycosyltransferase involved in cell wall biosynthesis
MRVLMLSWEYPPNVVGGLGKHVAELAPALAARGVELHVVTPRIGQAPVVEFYDNLTIHRVDRPQSQYADFYGEAWHTNTLLEQAGDELVQRYGPFDLVHNHDWITSFAAAALKQRHKLPLVGTIHATERGRGRGEVGGGQSRLINDAEWRLSYESWRVIVCTEFMQREVYDYFRTPADKTDVIPNGVDPSPFIKLANEDLTAFRARFALPHEKIVYSVGRIVQEKGIETLIQAAPLVLAQTPEAKFVVAGRGPELDYLRRMVGEMNLASKVMLLGFISDQDRNRLYCVADCAVFPSLYEPFGIVALEAMAAHVPVVVSEVGGLREVVQHGETGITVYPGSPESCAWGIVHTLQHPDWAAMRVENAYRKVETVFSWDTIASQTIDVYERVVAERANTVW